MSTTKIKYTAANDGAILYHVIYDPNDFEKI